MESFCSYRAAVTYGTCTRSFSLLNSTRCVAACFFTTPSKKSFLYVDLRGYFLVATSFFLRLRIASVSANKRARSPSQKIRNASLLRTRPSTSMLASARIAARIAASTKAMFAMVFVRDIVFARTRVSSCTASRAARRVFRSSAASASPTKKMSSGVTTYVVIAWLITSLCSRSSSYALM